MKIIPISTQDRLLIRRALRYLKPHRWRYFSAFLLILSSIGFEVIEPLLWGKIIVDLFNKNFNHELILIAIVFGLNSARTVTEFLSSYLFAFMSENIIFSIKKEMYRVVLNLPVKAFDEMKAGEFMSRIEHDASTLAQVLTNQFLNHAVDVLRVIIIGVTVFLISVPLALIIVASLPISLLIFTKAGSILRKKHDQFARSSDDYFSMLSESLWGMREIVSLGIKANRFTLFKSHTLSLKNQGIKISVVEGVTEAFSKGSNMLLYSVLLVLGSMYTMSGKLALDLFIAFSSYSNQLTEALINLTRLNAEIQEMMISITRIFHLMDNLSYQEIKYGMKHVKTIDGSIAFEKVSFGYDPACPVFKDFTLKIKPNRITAIVGSSGSGKTTLFNLLLKLYEVDSGAIFLGNNDINAFDEASLRNHISIVRQEPFLFEGTIEENLLLANPDAQRQKIEESCKAACIHDFIMSLPQNYSANMGENGVQLSGGQKQRLSIARAILKNSKIILFDEATSALDNESQYLIKKAIGLISKKHTVVVIAHRLSTIIEADNIVVIHNGCIHGQGKHAQLIHNNLIYKRLYKTELKIIETETEAIAN